LIAVPDDVVVPVETPTPVVPVTVPEPGRLVPGVTPTVAVAVPGVVDGVAGVVVTTGGVVTAVTGGVPATLVAGPVFSSSLQAANTSVKPITIPAFKILSTARLLEGQDAGGSGVP
jgi:hypothetical protein